MKKYLSRLSLLFLLAVVGCSDQTGITSPDQSLPQQEPNWIALPLSEGMQVNQVFATSKLITGKDGGTMVLNVTYSGGIFGSVTINSSLYFPKTAFPGKEKTFTMAHDDAACVTTFGPSFQFDKYLTFNITYTGIDLRTVNPANVRFAYLGTDGSVQYAINDGIVMDLSAGRLQVINARVPHFSRYGFIN